jgi:hypothetical protein
VPIAPNELFETPAARNLWRRSRPSATLPRTPFPTSTMPTRALAPQTLVHARSILRIGELIGVSSRPQRVLPLLPAATRELFAPHAQVVRPGLLRRWSCRLLGRLFVPRAVGRPRTAVPFAPATGAAKP